MGTTEAMKQKLLIMLFMTLALALLLPGCASRKPPKIAQLDYSMVMSPAGTSNLQPEEINGILEEVEKRNRDVEDDPEWIDKSYLNFMLRRLTNVSVSEFDNYRKYLDDGAVYIVVHPAFFTFFHYARKVRADDPEEEKMNILEILLNRKPSTSEFAVLQAQERRMRDFIEFKSTQNKLVIMVIPQNYRKYSGYTYRKGKDEYLRFLNETTNFSRSVLFVESRSANRGYLTDDDAVKLMEFLLSVNAEKVYVGGGYIGRCLEDFYSLLTNEFGEKGIFVVPELADISPRELNPRLAMRLLKPDGLINYDYATELMVKDKYKVQELIPQIENLH